MGRISRSIAARGEIRRIVRAGRPGRGRSRRSRPRGGRPRGSRRRARPRCAARPCPRPRRRRACRRRRPPRRPRARRASSSAAWKMSGWGFDRSASSDEVSSSIRSWIPAIFLYFSSSSPLADEASDDLLPVGLDPLEQLAGARERPDVRAGIALEELRPLPLRSPPRCVRSRLARGRRA